MNPRRNKVRANTETRIGTSGWHYRHWWGDFYPPKLRKKDALSHYTTRFDAAELNAPFYRTPTDDAVKAWRDGTPQDFRFAWKASKFITHWRRLLIDGNSMDLLHSRLDVLGEKLGPVLFQLPPRMQANRERLAAFLAHLPRTRRWSFEFRHESWYDESIFGVLRDHNAALCLSDHADAPAPTVLTADWAYVRNHGPSGRYHGSYSDEDLERWAGHMRSWRLEGHDTWCFFDNDIGGAAPRDAERLLDLLALEHGEAGS